MSGEQETPGATGPDDRAGEGADDDWGRQRREVIAAKEEALRLNRQREHEAATAKIRAAIARFEDAGIPARPLKAMPYTGSGTIRTSLHGWYLKRDRTIAVDTEGRYYVMRVDGGLRSRLRGATPEPSPAPLVVGRGARDGETFDLDELLEMRFDDPVEP